MLLYVLQLTCFVADSDPALSFAIETEEMSKPMCSLWGALNEYLITGHDDGTLCQWDIKVSSSRLVQIALYLLQIYFLLQTGEFLHSTKEHGHLIKDMQLSNDQMMLITASKDKTAKVNISICLISVLTEQIT